MPHQRRRPAPGRPSATIDGRDADETLKPIPGPRNRPCARADCEAHHATFEYTLGPKRSELLCMEHALALLD